MKERTKQVMTARGTGFLWRWIGCKRAGYRGPLTNSQYYGILLNTLTTVGLLTIAGVAGVDYGSLQNWKRYHKREIERLGKEVMEEFVSSFIAEVHKVHGKAKKIFDETGTCPDEVFHDFNDLNNYSIELIELIFRRALIDLRGVPNDRGQRTALMGTYYRIIYGGGGLEGKTRANTLKEYSEKFQREIFLGILRAEK